MCSARCRSRCTETPPNLSSSPCSSPAQEPGSRDPPEAVRRPTRSPALIRCSTLKKLPELLNHHIVALRLSDTRWVPVSPAHSATPRPRPGAASALLLELAPPLPVPPLSPRTTSSGDHPAPPISWESLSAFSGARPAPFGPVGARFLLGGGLAVNSRKVTPPGKIELGFPRWQRGLSVAVGSIPHGSGREGRNFPFYWFFFSTLRQLTSAFGRGKAAGRVS